LLFVIFFLRYFFHIMSKKSVDKSTLPSSNAKALRDTLIAEAKTSKAEADSAKAAADAAKAAADTAKAGKKRRGKAQSADSTPSKDEPKGDSDEDYVPDHRSDDNPNLVADDSSQPKGSSNRIKKKQLDAYEEEETSEEITGSTSNRRDFGRKAKKPRLNQELKRDNQNPPRV
jgi:hypothetical protein